MRAIERPSDRAILLAVDSRWPYGSTVAEIAEEASISTQLAAGAMRRMSAIGLVEQFKGQWLIRQGAHRVVELFS